MENCIKCFTCEHGVIPTITKQMLDDAVAKDGKIPDEWLVQGECKACVTCEKCFSHEGCEKCFTCEKCDTGQEGALATDESCINCFACEKCFTEEKNCEKCVTCEKCFSEQDGEKRGASTGNITYFLFPTNQCNLRCDYCYATKRPMVMDKATADQVMKWIVYDEEERNPGRKVSIQFFGGEPTMEWDLLVYIIEKMEKYGEEILKRPIKFGMTTNGTLLDERKMQFMKEHKLTPLLSLDGRRETHNKHRRYENGGGSWDDIDFDMFLKYFPNPEIRPTILPDTVEDWIEDVQWFHSKGCYTVATEVAYEADWNDEAMEKARKTYNALGDIYIDMKKQGKKVWMKFIDDGRGFLGAKNQTGNVCGIGKNTIAIDAKGNLFACQRYASFSKPELKLGDVFNGWDWSKLEEANKLKREDMFADPKGAFNCETCHALWKCRGGCNAMNYQCNADRRIILENHCKFQRLWAEVGLRVLASTGELWDILMSKGKQPKHTCGKKPEDVHGRTKYYN